MTPATPVLEARALTVAALEQLTVALKNAEGPDDFFALADAIVADRANQLTLPIQLGPPDSIAPEDTGGIDSANSPIIHEYLGEMDRANAADPRLWTYLALVTYRDYMEARWSMAGVRNWQNRVRTRWLLPRPTRGSLIRHGIARLWWIAHLTWDVTGDLPLTKDDRYAYTRQVLVKEDRILAIFDREIGAMPTVVRAVLEHIAAGGEAMTERHVRNLMRNLTLAHGYRDIGILDKSDVRALVRQTASTTG